MSFLATCINNVKKLTALFHLLLMHFFFNLAESVLLNYASEQQTGECNKARYLIMAEQGPDILSHEGRIAKKSVDRWRRFKHRRAPKCAENHKFANVGESIDVMRKGTLITKLRSSSKKYPRKYFLDQEAVNICWTPSKKGDKAKSKCLFI